MLLGPWYGYLAASKVILLFLLVFYYLPSRVVAFRRGDDGLDRFFITLTYMVSVTLVLVHLLAFLRLYDTFSLVVGYICIGALAMQAQGRSPVGLLRRLGTRAVVSLLDAAEQTRPLGSGIGEYLQRQVRASVLGLWSWARWAVNPAEGLLPMGVLVYSAYLRFHHSLTHAYLGAPDSYVHLAWTKYLSANQIYRDGIYPYGYHAVLSAFEKLTFMDPLLIVRFTGPLAGLLLVLSVYYVSRKLFRGLEILAVPGTFIFGLGIGLPSAISRQISALPQEFAAIFLLPGFYFGARYLERGTRRDLALFALCLGITVAVHPYVSPYLVVGVALAAAARFMSRPHIVGTQPVWRIAFNLFFWGAVAVAVALAPLGVGAAQGIEFHSSLEYVAAMVTTGAVSADDSVPVWQRLLSKDPFLDVTLALAGLLALHTAVVARVRLLKGEKPTEPAALMALPLFSLVLYLMYRGRSLGLPSLMDPARTGVFFSLVASLIYGMAAYRIVAALGSRLLTARMRTYLAAGFALVAVLCLGFRYPTSPPAGTQLEYDAAAGNYLRIQASFPALDWTIVSPVEQYPQVLKKGWHYESWEFVRDFGLAEANDPSFDLPIPTTYVFIFAEKIPLRVDKSSNPVLANGAVSSLAAGSASEPYRDPERRAVIQATLIAWAEAYMETHDNMRVFYEDEEMIIYMIKRAPRGTVGARNP